MTDDFIFKPKDLIQGIRSITRRNLAGALLTMVVLTGLSNFIDKDYLVLVAGILFMTVGNVNAKAPLTLALGTILLQLPVSLMLQYGEQWKATQDGIASFTVFMLIFTIGKIFHDELLIKIQMLRASDINKRKLPQLMGDYKPRLAEGKARTPTSRDRPNFTTREAYAHQKYTAKKPSTQTSQTTRLSPRPTTPAVKKPHVTVLTAKPTRKPQQQMQSRPVRPTKRTKSLKKSEVLRPIPLKQRPLPRPTSPHVTDLTKLKPINSQTSTPKRRKKPTNLIQG